MDDELAWMDATAQAALVRDGRVKPIELVDAAIARIEALDPQLNAVVIPLFELAREWATNEASLTDGPFRGVPIVVKDLGIDQAGQPHYQGNKLLRDLNWTAARDSPLGARFRAAGFVTVGRANTPEFGAQPATQPLAFGPTRNPWDTAMSTSGSSGGSAAAVASGMVPLAHANDGYGSIRHPASWCGVVGLKPSRGRNPIGATTSRNGAANVVSRSVRDTAGALDQLHTPATSELYHLAPPRRPYVDEVGADPGRLRVGLLTSVDATGIDPHPDCTAAAETAARLLEGLGHTVEPAGPSQLFDDRVIAQMTLVRSSRLRALNVQATAAIGRPFTADDVEPYSWAFAEQARDVDAAAYVLAVEWHQVWAARIVRWWTDSGFDLLLTPATGPPPQRIEDLAPPADDPLAVGATFQRIRCFTAPFNVTGNPAISLPLSWTAAGHPVGAQLVADLGREDLLIRVASQLEAAQPWSARRPPVSA